MIYVEKFASSFAFSMFFFFVLFFLQDRVLYFIQYLFFCDVQLSQVLQVAQVVWRYLISHF